MAGPLFFLLPYRAEVVNHVTWSPSAKESQSKLILLEIIVRKWDSHPQSQQKPCQIFWGLFNLLVEKGNSTSSSLNTHVTVLVRALSQLAKFFFSWKLFMHIQRCKLECVPLTGKKLITCNSCLWHSNTLVSLLSSSKREWFLMETSFVFWHLCTNNMTVCISDKGMPSLWALFFTWNLKG